jgi:hypothetical protein
MAANHLLVAARIRHSCQNSHHGIVDLCSKSRVFANAVKCFSFELPIYIKDSHEIYKWDLVNVKNFPSSGTLEPFMTTWNTLFFEKNAYIRAQSWFMTLLTWRKCLHVGLGKFYDDLEHSTFEKMLTCGTQLSYGPPWAHYLGGYQDRLLGGPLGLPGLRYTVSEGVEHKDHTGVVLG